MVNSDGPCTLQTVGNENENDEKKKKRPDTLPIHLNLSKLLIFHFGILHLQNCNHCSFSDRAAYSINAKELGHLK